MFTIARRQPYLTDVLQALEANSFTNRGGVVADLATPHLDSMLHLNDISLFGDPGSGDGFRLLRRYPLTG